MAKRKLALLDALDSYHDESDYYEMLETAAKDERNVPHAIVDFLRGWGGLARNLPGSGHERLKLEKALAEWLESHRPTLQRLRMERIWLVDFEKIGTGLEELFDSLACIRKGFGSTAAGKMLHVLLPNLCVLWDAKYVRGRQGFRDDGKGYVEYLKSRQMILTDALRDGKMQTGFDDPSTILKWLVDQHSLRFATCKPPVTKLLDEMNYDERGHVQAYLRSIRDRVRGG